MLQDRLLRAVGRDPDAVRGPEVGSHLEVALAVATGAVDAGLGVRSAAVDLDLEFVPVAREDYDVALPGRALDAAAPLVADAARPGRPRSGGRAGRLRHGACGNRRAEYLPWVTMPSPPEQHVLHGVLYGLIRFGRYPVASER